MGLVLLLVWIVLAASASLNLALLLVNAQLRNQIAAAGDKIDSLEALQGGSTGNESWRNDVL